MEKLFYSIGEVAEILGESTSAVRFWSNTFSRFIHPQRNAKGNRMFTREDVETFKQIHLLVKENGMTLDGAARRMADDRRSVENRVKALDSLRRIRAELVSVQAAL